MTTYRKKLIEVALPLVAINVASAREKSIRHGHPSTLHLWWARRPLAAARAVIFAQMVDDPSAYVDVLRADPKLRRKAETALKARLKLWEEARTLAQQAKSAGLAVVEPGPEPTLDEMLTDEERQRLFRIIEELVLWENTTNETVLQAARDEIWQSWRRTCAENADHPRAKELFDRHKLPGFHDPFAGGGALPLEAQRLGLEAYASDLNPVAVLINKAMIEIPPKFAGMPPVNPESRPHQPDAQARPSNAATTSNATTTSNAAITSGAVPKASLARRVGVLIPKDYHGAQGLAEDVRYYGKWMRDEAEKRIGNLYPKVEVTAEMAQERPDLQPYVGRKLTVIAWLWARTVKSPNPAFANVDVPLASTFMLGTKPGKEAYVEPVIENGGYRFTIKVGKPKDAEAAKNGTKLARGANFQCVMSGTPIASDYIYAEGKAGHMGARMTAIVAEGTRGRVYLAPTPEHEAAACRARPTWKPDQLMPLDRRWFSPPLYGMPSYGDLFTPRQLVALTTFSDLVMEARERVLADVQRSQPNSSRQQDDVALPIPICYADAVAVFVSFALSRAADRGSNVCSWDNSPKMEALRNTFGRQSIPMVWDFAEGNPFSESSGNWMNNVEWGAKALTSMPANGLGDARQVDATSQETSSGKVVSTDPPYYDNIGYADLSDFFYVWLRRSLKSVFPGLFTTLAVPKVEELIASPYRHGGKVKAEAFFLDGMTKAMRRIAEQTHPAFPVTIYYAFKQAESDATDGTASTGWDTFLDAVIRAGFSISGTWPMRTELSNRMIGSGTNALASSIVLVCRQRQTNALTATRREFVTALKSELPAALAHLQRGNIAPVDLAQAAIGPGMAVYTRYAKVLDAAGQPLSVREALALINQTLDEALAEQEGDFDADSRWALAWFEQSGFSEGEYGVAETLSTAKNISVQGLQDAGIVASSRGKVRLLKPDELPADWDPTSHPRLTAWETVHQLIRTLAIGEEPAAALVAKLGAKAEVARELAYRLYTLCERKKRAAEALAYNGLVQSWPELTRLAREGGKVRTTQSEMFGEGEE
jgi:putative DNA methylase